MLFGVFGKGTDPVWVWQTPFGAPFGAGKPLGPRPPIHLLFASDRGLRDGEWKLVSFRSTAWELYHLATDRAERNNVAAQYPDVRDRMVRMWHEMAENVLHVPAAARRAVTETTEKVHPEWTDFRKEPGASESKPQRGKPKPANAIRARIDTKLVIEGNQLVLHCSGTDSGIAIDRIVLPDDTRGPFLLQFQLNSQADGGGEVFFTTDAKTTLPRGTHLEFPVVHDNQWHEHSLKLETAERIHAIRFDPCSAPGVVRVRSLRLTDATGRVLHSWPADGSDVR